MTGTERYGGHPLPPYAVYNIVGGTPENLPDYIRTLQEELVRAGVPPEDYDFEGHRELVGMQPDDVPVTYADSRALEGDYEFQPRIGESGKGYGSLRSGIGNTIKDISRNKYTKRPSFKDGPDKVPQTATGYLISSSLRV